MVATGISSREREVLALIGDHLTNAEIAARLYLSVRTVESHVSSLLRKLEVTDRRSLARRAAERTQPEHTNKPPAPPQPLTSFVGRMRERAELTDEVKKHRLVTAVGPGGVGKTRLAQSVALSLADEFADGVRFVDLVPVTDAGGVAAAIASAVGIAEQPGRTIHDSILTTLADWQALLVLDNCEHVRDDVLPLVERVLTSCSGVRVLATSRVRLLAPFEHTYQVAPMSVTGADSDAVTLFLERAAAAGASLSTSHQAEAADICQRLDGIPLAIELAAARLPTRGVDGVAAGLSDQLRLLTGGQRADGRHASVRAALNWSHSLLSTSDQALLRRLAVFVEPFTATDAADVAGFDPLDADAVVDGLASLAEHSLLAVADSSDGTRYHALETVRQYGGDHLAQADEIDQARSRHLQWSIEAAHSLEQEAQSPGRTWRIRFDHAADDIRAALGWAEREAEHQAEAYRLALTMATLTFARKLLRESQHHYVQAATLAPDSVAEAAAFREAAAVAGCRVDGDEAYRLWCAAGEASKRAGAEAEAARDFATAAVAGFTTASETVASDDEIAALIRAARDLAGNDPAAQAAIALTDAAVGSDALGVVRGSSENDAPKTLAAAEHAVELARRAADPLAEAAALDALTGAQSWMGDPHACAATARERALLVDSLPPTPAATRDKINALTMMAETSLGIGDLAQARRWAQQLAEHPLLVEVSHYAKSRLLVVDALAGRIDELVVSGAQFLDDWEHAGRPPRPLYVAVASATAMAQDLRGDEDAREQWLTRANQISDQLADAPERLYGARAVFDAVGLLHHGKADDALTRLAPEPRDVWKWVTWIWLHYYVALKAEAAVLAGRDDARTRIEAARQTVAGNPVATAQVERAEALLDADRQRLLACADTFDAAGCRYQWARTLILAGGDDADAGQAAYAEMGIPIDQKPE